MSFLSALALKTFVYFSARNDKKRDKGLVEPPELTVFRNVRYAPGGAEHLLDVYTLAREGEVLPSLVSVHGGGFCYGDKELYRFYCMHLALQGYTVFNFNYRLLPEKFPAPLEDLNAVMQFLSDHAREYRADRQTVYAVGDSVGALLLSVYAGMTVSPAYAAEYPFLMSPVRFRAIGLHSGVYDCGKGFLGPSRHAVAEWTEGDARAKRLLCAKEYVREGFPPVFLSYSVNDPVTAASPALAELLRARGVPCACAEYGRTDKKLGHVFHLDVRSAAAADCGRKQKDFFAAAGREN